MRCFVRGILTSALLAAAVGCGAGVSEIPPPDKAPPPPDPKVMEDRIKEQMEMNQKIQQQNQSQQNR